MRRILYSLLAFLGVTFAIALVAPWFVDVNGYKPQILAKAREALGRDVNIDGKLALSLFPSPGVSVEGVRIAGLTRDSGSDLAKVKHLRVSAEFWPLLRKHIKISSIELDEPKIYLEKLADGRVNWDFDLGGGSAGHLLSDSSKRTSKSAAGFDVAVDKITVRNGFLTYSDRSGRQNTQPVEMKDINVQAGLNLLQGSYQVKGNFNALGRTLNVEANVATRGEVQDLTFKAQTDSATLSITGETLPVSLTFKGVLEASGNFHNFIDALPPSPYLPFLSEPIYMKAQVLATAQEISLTQAQVHLGSARPTGNFKISLKDNPGIVGEVTSLPGEGKCQFSMAAGPAGQRGQVTGTLKKARDFFAWLGIEKEAMPETLNAPLAFSTNYTLGEKMRLDHLDLMLKEARILGDISWQGVEGLMVDLSSPQVENVLKVFGIRAPGTLGKGQVKGAIRGDASRINFDVATFFGPTQLTVKGVTQSLKGTLQFDVNMEGGSSHLPTTLKSLGQKDLPTFVSSFEKGKILGKIAGTLYKLALDVRLNLDQLALGIRGDVASLMNVPKFNLGLSLAHPDSKSLFSGKGRPSRLAANTPSKMPAGAISLASNIQGDANHFYIKGLQGNIGRETKLSGNIEVDRTTLKPNIKVNLSTGAFHLDTLLADQTALPHPSIYDAKIYLVGGLQGADHPAQHKWSPEPLDLSFLNNFDAQISLAAEQLFYKDILISHPKLTAKIEKGRLDIAPFTASIYEGELRVNGYLTSQNALNMEMALKDAALKNIFSHQQGIKIVAGRLSLSTSLKTQGKSLDHMVRNLNGPLLVNAKDGVIDGFDLHAISQKLSNLKDIQSVLGLLNYSMAKGQTPFSSFAGDIVFKQGIGTIQSMKLLAKGGEVTSMGHIDLPHYTLDVTSEIRLTEHPRLPTFRMRLSGALDNPSRQLDTRSLQKYLMDNVFKNMVGQLGKGGFKPADILGSLMGKNKAAPANQDNPPSQGGDNNQPKANKPEQVIKDALKGLFR